MITEVCKFSREQIKESGEILIVESLTKIFQLYCFLETFHNTMLEESIMTSFIWVLIFPQIHGILQLDTAARGLKYKKHQN